MLSLHSFKEKTHFFSMIFWTLSIFIYYFQFPFNKLSTFLIPSFSIFLLFEFTNFYVIKDKKFYILYFIYTLYLMIMFVFSFVNGVSLYRIVRFFLILSIIPACFFVRDKYFDKNKEIFIWLSISKSILLIAFALYLLIKGDHTFIRGLVNSLNMGDIYLTASGIPKVQVQGNALLLIAFMIEFLDNKGHFNIKNIILLFGVISAGNFAFILGLFLFFVYILVINLIKNIKVDKNKIIIIAVSIFCILFLMSPYIKGKLESKVESNNIKVDQALILLDGNIIFGEGLGNPIKAQTENVIYDGNIYFELQTLYIINQIGIIGISLFYIITIWQIKKDSKKKLIIYMIYLFYTFFNPYCFDITQMISIVCITNMIQRENINDYCNYHNLLSKYK